MPITITWDNEAKTIIHWRYIGKWTWEEATSVFDDTTRMMSEVQHPVSLIHDLSLSNTIPARALSNAQRFTSALPENWNISVIVDPSGFGASLLNIFAKLYQKLGAHYRVAPNLHEARRIIEQSSGVMH
ncbi:MAG: hypothetical protein GC204_02650 [Chloroflexi bacterium]|nr:hypothetical protein [Chloroflexota bacterium]